MDNTIRTRQLLSPFGIGQIVTFPEELSLMVCGLELWDKALEDRKLSGGIDKINEDKINIHEERLERLLNVDFFRKPFPYKTEKDADINTLLNIPGVRFPSWHHCINPKCGRMKKIPLNHHSQHIECLKSEGGCGQKMIPVRFVAACENGHIQDVPFKKWVHNGAVPKDDKKHELCYNAHSGSGDLGSIYINCTCGEFRSLPGIMDVSKDEEHMKMYDSALARIGMTKEDDREFSYNEPNDKSKNPLGEFCSGHKPWLGRDGISNSDDCGRHLRILIKGGSNIHYSNIQSALFLPRVSEDVDQHVQEVINEFPGGIQRLKDLYEQEANGRLLKIVLEGVSVVKNGLISLGELKQGIVEEFDNTGDDNKIYNEKDIRWDEYEYILRGRESENSDFKAIVKDFDNFKYQNYLEEFFDKVVLIEKLKETRVFTGFSRISPVSGDLEKNKKMLSSKDVNWLPAHQTLGEGIFLKFRDNVLDKWVLDTENYFSSLIDRYNSAMYQRKPVYQERDINGAFVLMHTLAHLLINRLCYNCGYGSSALKERIYFSSDEEKRMNGILIYTSSGDSEGSLGGLVRQGREQHLGKLIKDSIEDARWCSADPVCSEIGQKSGQGPDNMNGSACHNCCLVPETSCEEFNGLLDRATVIGTLDKPELGLFV
jgi:hypothetical protein